MAGTKRRPTRQVAKRSLYVEPDTDDDFEYDDGEADYQPELARMRPPPSKRVKTAPRPKHVTRSKSVRTKSAVRTVAKGIGRRRKPNTFGQLPKKEFDGPSDGRIPDWTSLPVDILRDIFDYASRPRHEETRTASANVDWLLKTARTCRAFAIPALEAYYQAPSLLTNLQPHHLLELLQMDHKYINYNAKVKSLQISMTRLAYSALNKGLFDLSSLIPLLPQLHHMEILHPTDDPPFRLSYRMRWHYPINLFRTMEESGTRLKTWRWNSDMISATDPGDRAALLARAHTTGSLQSLTKLTLCDFNDAILSNNSDAPTLAAIINLLPNLQDLSFVSCEVVVDRFLEHLPKALHRLQLTNCLELTSAMLQAYLITGGAQLRELVLDHNPALNLSFVTGLKTSCPRLETLSMDLRYYSERMNSDDSEPLYDELLAAGEVPTWPATLRHVELVHLQRWAAEAAQNFYQSLLDAADQLPDLRHLALHSHINIPWRQRAEFRDQWIERLQRVFARKFDPPNPYLGSIKQFRLWKQAQHEGWDISSSGKAHVDDDSQAGFTVGKRVSHVALPPVSTHEDDVDVYSDSSPNKRRVPSKDVRRSRRVAEASQAAVASAATPSATQESASDDDARSASDWRHKPETYIQGLCDVVDIRIDNQRPRENQFTEGDFLDSEASGDEDWREGNDEGDDEGFAW